MSRASVGFWIFFGLLAVLLFAGVQVVTSRGIRNNNPGNLRPLSGGQKWDGQTGVDDGGYLVFSSMAYGVRAMARDLKNKIGRGLDTIDSIIPVYAPAGDNNDPASYIAAVSSSSGIDPSQPLGDSDLPSIIRAMIREENGLAASLLVSDADIQNGVAMS